MGGYTYRGRVIFEFSDVFVEETDPYEARHEVESMTIQKLLEHMTYYTVTIERERVT